MICVIHNPDAVVLNRSMLTYESMGSLIASKIRNTKNNVEVSIWPKANTEAKLQVLVKY